MLQKCNYLSMNLRGKILVIWNIKKKNLNMKGKGKCVKATYRIEAVCVIHEKPTAFIAVLLLFGVCGRWMLHFVWKNLWHPNSKTNITVSVHFAEGLSLRIQNVHSLILTYFFANQKHSRLSDSVSDYLTKRLTERQKYMKKKDHTDLPLNQSDSIKMYYLF